MKTFSVLMSVYKNDRAEYIKDAIYSISTKQTVQPDEVVLVVDGPVPLELEGMINRLVAEIPYIRPIWLPENKGLGNALNIGLLECKNEIVMRMDSDDVSVPNRFELQLQYLDKHPDVAVVGGQITEFIDKEDNIVGKRVVPSTTEEITKGMKKRCTINHVTAALIRSRVLDAGNYQDWFWNEDYWLWIRMYEKGCIFGNVSDTLVNVRVGKDMYARRGSWRYFKSEAGIQRYMLKNNMISLPLYCFNVMVRFIVQVLMPNSVRAFMFKKIFRK